MNKILLCSVAVLLSNGLFGTAHANNTVVSDALKAASIPFDEIQSSPIPSISMVYTEEGILYVTNDGKYIFQSPLYDISNPKTPVNATLRAASKKIALISDQTIEYKAPKEKHVITIFTDPTCSYCVKLQNNMDEYNKLGITIRYLAFSREGTNSPVVQQLQNIWCAKDQKKAFADAVKKRNLPKASCNIDTNQHYKLGVQVGVRGTPAILYKEMLIPGYMEPAVLIKILDNYNA